MLQHHNGGKIVTLKQIGHETFRGVADWFFVADIEWSDGSKSKDAHVSPCNLCYEGDRTELDSAMRQLNQYLERHGEWHKPIHKRDGRVVNWTPKAKAGREPVTL